MITGKLYDGLKFLALIAFPAFATLYFALAGIWGLPAAEQIVGTIVALDTFLGVVLQISSSAYNKNAVAQGAIKVLRGKAGKTFSLELDGDPEYELEGKEKAVFQIKKETV